MNDTLEAEDWATQLARIDWTGGRQRRAASLVKATGPGAPAAPSQKFPPYAPPVAATDNTPRERFNLTWFDNIAESAPKQTFIKGVFGDGEFTTISGLPGTGKSVIVTDMALHVAAGKEWHGRRVKQGMVVYIAAERKPLTERRMLAFRKRHGVKDVPLLVLGGRIDLTSSLRDASELAATINAAATECGSRCIWIIVDTLTRTFGPGDQNVSKDMTKFVMSCDELGRLTGAHISVIHHTAWSGDRGKGAIDLDGAVDASFMVRKSGGTYTLECNGTNDGEEGVILTFGMEGVAVGVDEDGITTMAPVVVSTTGVADRLSGALKGHNAIVLAALRSCLESQGVTPIGEQFPQGVLVVKDEEWRRTYYEAQKGVVPNTLKQRFNRGKKSLLDAGEVLNVGLWFWPA